MTRYTLVLTDQEYNNLVSAIYDNDKSAALKILRQIPASIPLLKYMRSDATNNFSDRYLVERLIERLFVKQEVKASEESEAVAAEPATVSESDNG